MEVAVLNRTRHTSANKQLSYRHYLIYAIILHAVVLVLLIGGFVIDDKPTKLVLSSIEASVQQNIPKDKADIAAQQKALAKAKALAKKRAQEQAAKAEARRLHQLTLAQARIKARKAKFARLRQQALAKKRETLAKQMLQKQLRAEQAHLRRAQLAARAAAQAKKNAAIVNQYQQRILQAISQVWVIPRGIQHNLDCIVNAQIAADGTVLKVSIAQSSGSTVLDQSALQAVYQASPLPVPQNPALFAQFSNLRLTLRPEKIVHVP